MGGVALSIVVASCLMWGGVCGLVSRTMATRAQVTKHVAFGWGAALGPFGILLVASLATKRSEVVGKAVRRGIRG